MPPRMPDSSVVFLVVAGIIIFAFASELFFKKTGVPSFLFLILIGILLGPVLNIFPGQQLRATLGIFAELTLVMVLFYSGLDMKIRSLLQGSGRALVLVLLYVSTSILTIGFFSHFVLGWDLTEAFAFSAIIAGQTSTPVVVPLAKSLRLPVNTVTIITLESVSNSIFAIVLFFTFVRLYKGGFVDWTSALSGIASNFSIGIVLGLILSLAWIFVLERFKNQRYTYVLTLGLLLATFSVTVGVRGSGELAVFVFGLVLGNYKLLNSITKREISMDVLMKRLGTFQDEIAFLLNTLFFVFLGLTFLIEPREIILNLTIGLVLVGALLGSRLFATIVSTTRSELSKDRGPILLLSAQGVTQATLAIIAWNEGLQLGSTFLSLVAYVVILTNLIATIGSLWIRRRRKFDFRTFTEGLQENYHLPQG